MLLHHDDGRQGAWLLSWKTVGKGMSESSGCLLVVANGGCRLVTRPCVDGGDGAPSSGSWASFGRGDGEPRTSSERLVRVVGMRKMVTSRL